MKNDTPKDSSRVAGFLENPRKALWKLSLPVFGGSIIHTLYSVADMIFVGRVGPEAVTALAFNIPLFFLAFGISMGLSSGVTAVLAQAIGSKDKARADNTAEHAVVVGLIIALTLSATGLIFGKQLLGMLGAEGQVLVYAWEYFRVIAFGLLFVIMSSFFRGILVGEGDTVRPMSVMGSAMILNIILDPIFIFTLDMGVAGAAWATVISQILSNIVLIYMLFKSKSTYVKFRLRNFSFSPELLGSIFKIGIPASLSFSIMAVGSAVFNKILSSYSQDAVAAYQIANRIEMIYFMPIIALGIGCVTLVAMFYGAKEMGQVRAIINYTIKSAVTIGAVAGVVIYFAAPYVMVAFTQSSAIIEYGTQYLQIIVFIFPIVPLGMISARVMQGMGRGMPFLVVSFLRVIGVGVPLALLFTYVMDKPIAWVWYSIIIAILISSAVGRFWLEVELNKFDAAPAPLSGQKLPDAGEVVETPA